MESRLSTLPIIISKEVKEMQVDLVMVYPKRPKVLVHERAINVVPIQDGQVMFIVKTRKGFVPRTALDYSQSDPKQDY